MNVTGIIFANDGTVSELTDNRTMASLPFGGRYRQIDFALSNLSCAGVHRIGIIPRHSYQSLMNHVGSGEEWGLEMGEGGLEYLTPLASSTTTDYRGKLESLHCAMSFLSCGPENEYVVMIDSAILSNLDLGKILTSHVESGRDITLVTKAGIADGQRQLDLAVKLDDNGEITDMTVDYAAPADYEASMDLFIVNKSFLIQQVKEHIAHNLYHMDRDLVMGLWQKNAISIHVYSFDGLAMYNESVEEYFQNSLSLLQKEVRQDLFGRNHPVFTKVRDRVPSFYGDSCQIHRCSVADGCMLAGTVRNSILFRQVTVCPTAQVDSCVIMNDTVVGEGCELRYVILDKDVTIRPGTKLIGAPNKPMIIKRGAVV